MVTKGDTRSLDYSSYGVHATDLLLDCGLCATCLSTLRSSFEMLKNWRSESQPLNEENLRPQTAKYENPEMVPKFTGFP